MSYYHIIATWNPDSPVTKELFTDLSPKQVRSKFVHPYLRGHHVLAGNDQVDVAQITKLRIVKTDRTSEEVRSRLNAESRRQIDEINAQGDLFVVSVGFGYEPEDILVGGEDVTHQFIKGTVGSKKGRPWYVTFILTLFGTIIAAGIVYYLGWK